MCTLDELHELLTGLSLAKCSREVTSRSQGVLLLHATHLHTHVLCLYDNDYAKGIKSLLDTILNLPVS